MAHGAAWMLLFKFAERSLGLISMLILVRLLSPTDFGITAMAGSFILMAEMLTAFSFDVNLIQNQNATEEHYSSAWTCNVLLGLTITALMLAAAPAITAFYRHDELFWVVCALALGPLVSGFENIGVVAFRKDMQFGREFAFQLSRKVIGFLVAVPLAYLTHSYWALVAAILVSKLSGTAISYFVHPFRPRFSLAKFRGLLVFSKWMLLNNFVGFLKVRDLYHADDGAFGADQPRVAPGFLPHCSRSSGDAGRLRHRDRHAGADRRAGCHRNIRVGTLYCSDPVGAEVAARRALDGDPCLQWRTAIVPLLDLHRADRQRPSRSRHQDQWPVRGDAADTFWAVDSRVRSARGCHRRASRFRPLHSSIPMASAA
jgi:hypothetical protein